MRDGKFDYAWPANAVAIRHPRRAQGRLESHRAFSRDPDFVDRGDVLDQLRQWCFEPVGQVALLGLGGIGCVLF